MAGFEPATSWFITSCANQLRYMLLRRLCCFRYRAAPVERRTAFLDGGQANAIVQPQEERESNPITLSAPMRDRMHYWGYNLSSHMWISKRGRFRNYTSESSLSLEMSTH